MDVANSKPVPPPMPLALEALLPDEDMLPSSGGSHSNSGDEGSAFTNGAPSHPHPSRGMPFEKFRTKMCHYYLVGRNCPFRERCAFAHGEEQLNTPMPQAAVERVFASHQQREANAYGYGGYQRYPNVAAPPYGSLPSFDAALSTSTRSIHANAPIVSMQQSLQSGNVTRVNSLNDGPCTPPAAPTPKERSAAEVSASATGTNANAASFVSASSNIPSAPVSPSQLPPPPSYSESQTHGKGRGPFPFGLRLFPFSGSNSPRDSVPSSPLDNSGRFRYDPYAHCGFSIVA